MAKMMKRRISKAICLTVCVLTLIFSSLFLCGRHLTASADASVFEINYGASVKLTKNGLRFKVKMSEDYYAKIVTDDASDQVELWGYIAPVEEFDKVAETKDLGKKVGGRLAESKIYSKDGYYWSNIAITDLDTYTYQDIAFSATFFIVDRTSGTPVYTYAEMAKKGNSVSDIANQTRSQYQVVNAALLDPKDDNEQALINIYGEWFGEEGHPIVLNSTDEYDSFVTKLSDSAFQTQVKDKEAFVKEAVSTAVLSYPSANKIPDGLVTESNGHIVTFYDGNKIIKKDYVADGTNANAPANPARDGYDFVGWSGDYTGVTGDVSVYARWKASKGVEKTLGDVKVYGVTRTDGTTISSSSDVIGQNVILAAGDLAAGSLSSAYDYLDPTESADQAFIAYDGNYGFNDYFVADFTGKNMPMLAFFANGYDKSVFSYGGTSKNGVVVATGLTESDGRLYTLFDENGDDPQVSTSIFNGKGLCVLGPHMIYHTIGGANGSDSAIGGVLASNTAKNLALGRANLVNGKHYRIIMGFKPGSDTSNKAIKLVYVLYDLDSDQIVETFEQDTYNFFATGWANAGQTRDQFCSGSIVAYGYFAATTVLDKVYDIYEDTDIATISKSLNMKEIYYHSAKEICTTAPSINADEIVLKAGSLGTTDNNNSGGYGGPNANDDGYQEYLALNGDYSFDDYVVFDFTGKNMPEVAFFARNYDDSMYRENGGKYGVVVASGVMTWNGSGYSALGNGTNVHVSGPYMGYFASAADGTGGNLMGAFSSQLARANLADNTHYRIIMGFTTATDSRVITLKYLLYNLDEDSIVEEISKDTWALFANIFSDGRDTLHGSVVLYGKFKNVTTTIDKIYGMYEDTTISNILVALGMNKRTVRFNNYDGSELLSVGVTVGVTPEYTGCTPTREGDAVYSEYTFNGWDREITAVTGDTTYTATFVGTKRSDVSLNNVSVNGEGVVLGYQGLAAGWTYTGPNDNEYIHQSYLAFDGNYGFNDYVVFDFTGKNMPSVAFFAKNYNDSMYYQYGNKQGIVVLSGLTWWDGQLHTGYLSQAKEVALSGPRMVNINDNAGAAVNAKLNFQGATVTIGTSGKTSTTDLLLGRANLVDGTKYRIIMGMKAGSEAGRVTLVYNLYTLDASGNMTLAESFTGSTWNYMSNSADQLYSGAIMLYGHFGTNTNIDKVWGVFEDTTVSAIASGFGNEYTVEFLNDDGSVLQNSVYGYGSVPHYNGETPVKVSDAVYDYTFTGWDKSLTAVMANVQYTAVYESSVRENMNANNASPNGNEGVVLSAGSIGNGAGYPKGDTSTGYVHQSYLAFDGDYGVNSFIALDFTGKNMPEVAFFAKDYNDSMYAQSGEQGIVVVSGITTWDGQLNTGILAGSTQIDFNGPFMIQGLDVGWLRGGGPATSQLARANLVDGKRYRVIIGFTKYDLYGLKLNWYLYDLDNSVVVEETTTDIFAHNFFDGNNEAVNYLSYETFKGSIVLYGKFGTSCTIDKIWGVYENTDMGTVIESFDHPTAYSNAPNYSAYTDTFDFYAYSAYSNGTYTIDGETYYAGRNLATVKQYSLYGEAGLNVFFPQRDFSITSDPTTVTNAKKLIDDLAKAGITKTILYDGRLVDLSLRESAIVGSGKTYATEDALDEFVYNCIKDYADYPGVYGIQLGDEPKYACLSAYSAVYKSLKRVCADHGYDLFIQYNLNPLLYNKTVYEDYYPATSGTYSWDNYRYSYSRWWSSRDRFADCVKRYKQYIKDFLDAMAPDSITYDTYPLMESASGTNYVAQEFIPGLQIVAKEASNRGIKFYNVTQAHENMNDGSNQHRYVTESGAKWLNNILLGMGVKGIAYYTYYTRSEADSTGSESYKDGSSFVDYNGNPTDLYYVMQDIIANDQKFAKTILQFKYLGSRYYKGSTVATDGTHVGKITTADSFRKLSSFATNKEYAFVTELYDEVNGNYMYMVMNLTDPDAGSAYSETMTMTFANYTHALVFQDGEFSDVALTDHVLTVNALPGDAAFVIPYIR